MIKMRLRSVAIAFVTLATCPGAFGQRWEVGGGAGASFFTSQNVKNAAASGEVGLSDGVNASFWVSNNSRPFLGGDLRYDYENTSLRLSSAGQKATFDADTHAIHYDFVVHFRPRESRVRPYLSAGGGVKLYRGTGKESPAQPISNLALLTKTNDLRPLLSVGCGAKVALSNSFQLRVEAHDAITPLPSKVLAAAQGSKIGAWLQDFAVLIGVSFTF